MVDKSQFSADEWERVKDAPAVAGVMVVTAQRGGTLREAMEMARAWTEARGGAGGSALLDELVASPPAIDPQRFSSPDELRTRAPQMLRDAVSTLEAKADPDEVEAYKQFIVTLAQRVAEAHKEGGFLGIGGEKVGEDERAALDQIRSALGAG